MPEIELAEELLQIEEADAWFEYLEATRVQSETRYAEVEPWAWARLNQRLRAVRARRARLRPCRSVGLAVSPRASRRAIRAPARCADTLHCEAQLNMAMVFDIRSARPVPGGEPCARARYNEERHYLPWFRWKNKKKQDAPEGAVTETPAAPAEPEAAQQAPHSTTAEATATGAEAEALRNKRRRGSRGGRGRKRPGRRRSDRRGERRPRRSPQEPRRSSRRGASAPSAPPTGAAPEARAAAPSDAVSRRAGRRCPPRSASS